MSQSPECVLRCANNLGEVPLWCADSRRLWWVDVKAPALQSYDPDSGAHAQYPLPGRAAGSWGFRKQGGMVLALQDGLYSYAPQTGACELLAGIESHETAHRLNDGRCDRKGRFWVGSMHESDRSEPRGALYKVGTDLSVTSMFGPVMVPNSIAFSPDDRLMYFADTPTRKIWVFDFDLEEGRLSNRRVFFDLVNSPGTPDGSTVDADGCLWNAEYRGARVVRYTPQGKIDRVIELPVSQPTSCIFGGDDFGTLYITSAAQKLDPAERARQPEAGGLFAVRVGVQGMREPAFGP
ncbi:MAG TPA: SMP-30/gluconolactonase/LRE family protein [Burkholderiales bacterium]|nr:SMP-30/gluconolactonase/LRE family protein [Burkholderiales bacterium]